MKAFEFTNRKLEGLAVSGSEICAVFTNAEGSQELFDKQALTWILEQAKEKGIEAEEYKKAFDAILSSNFN